MNNTILGMLAETPIHPGAGRDLGVVDLPVAREAATDYPVIVGSGVKGGFRDAARKMWKSETNGSADTQAKDAAEVQRLFGQQVEAGQLLFSDARLLLLPVRSLTGQYRWLTCPHILERLQRDLRRTLNHDVNLSLTIRSNGSDRCALANDAAPEGGGFAQLFLEEWQLTVTGGIPNGVKELLTSLVKHKETRDRIAAQLVIVSNDDFAWFARYSLSVQARNVLDVEKKTSKNLWYEETLPPDTLMYTVLQERHEDALSTFQKMLDHNSYVQLGGNETVGQGWFAIQQVNAATLQKNA